MYILMLLVQKCDPVELSPAYEEQEEGPGRWRKKTKEEAAV
jgi:hypothetical protein